MPIKIHILVFYPPITFTAGEEVDRDSMGGGGAREECGRHDYACQDKREGETEHSYDAHVSPLNDLDRLITSVAEEYRGRVIFIRVPATDQSLLLFFGITAASLPQIVAADMSQSDDLKKYAFKDYASSASSTRTRTSSASTPLTGDRNAEEVPVAVPPQGEGGGGGGGTLRYTKRNLRRFLDALLGGTLRRSIASEGEGEGAAVEETADEGNNSAGAGAGTAPEVGAGGGVKVVGSNFHSKVVGNVDVDSFVYFFAPWCAYCKSFESIFEQLVIALHDDTTLQAVKMDATKNEVDHPNVHIHGYPTLYFFSTDRYNPIEYDGER